MIKDSEETFKAGNHNITIQVLDKAGNSDMRTVSFSII